MRVHVRACVCVSAYIIHLLKPFAANLLASFFCNFKIFLCCCQLREKYVRGKEKKERGGGEKYVVLLGVDKSTLAADVAVAVAAAAAVAQKAASRRE